MTDKKDKDQETEIIDEKLEKRRKALKNILAGSGTVVTAAAMQDKWAKPVIESVVLPAHAQTSDLPGSFVSSNQQTENGSDLLDTLVPSAMAAPPCVFELCITITGATEGSIVTVQMIDGIGSPPVDNGKGSLDKNLSFSFRMQGSGNIITGTVSGSAPNRVINGTYNGNCNKGSYQEVPEAPGSCQLTGSTTTSTTGTSGTTNTTRTTSTTRTGTTGTTSTTPPP